MTASQIASEIGRTPPAVYGCLRRLQVTPAATSGRLKLYHPSVIARVRRAMRRPNRSPVPTTKPSPA